MLVLHIFCFYLAMKFGSDCVRYREHFNHHWALDVLMDPIEYLTLEIRRQEFAKLWHHFYDDVITWKHFPIYCPFVRATTPMIDWFGSQRASNGCCLWACCWTVNPPVTSWSSRDVTVIPSRRRDLARYPATSRTSIYNCFSGRVCGLANGIPQGELLIHVNF